jgi:hypothetical protein
MSTNQPLEDRRKALEESFFQKENEHLLEKLRENKERAADREALATQSKIADEAILDHLIDVGIRAQTWLAVQLVPLVEVAWADREMDSTERDAILKAAAEHGMDDQSDAGQLLESWLARRPHPKLRAAWAAYMESAMAEMSDTARETLRKGILDQARSVARSTGGFLGFGSHVSEAEERVLNELAQALMV